MDGLDAVDVFYILCIFIVELTDRKIDLRKDYEDIF